ncbi:MAG TPA: FG-GAP-like repeat-containing protein [Hymenobacter sp.]|uniref:FG-GAP-like repeat-containing protein n=1 Tax=Hymenobacter sp. TaxID=1898978 RepID=UPI002D7FFA61|nr:FG-GAP-like repeat-containing protein [Hymenobacter sp.]HET9503538.1 FG-GAP-like repeat-containing protein [Hymenobacter sp.]
MQHRYSSLLRWVPRPLAALGLLLATAGAAHAQTPAATFAPVAIYGTGSSPRGIAVADVNGDGKPDLLTTNSGSNDVSVLLGNGNGTFQAATTYGTGGGSPFGIAVADVNGDGQPDVLTANLNSNTASVLLGTSNGTFQPAATFNTGGTIPVSVTAADVNGDGKPDLLAANSGSSTAGVLLGNGNGTFQPAVTYRTSTNPFAVKVADVNGDGKPDLLTANRIGASVSVLVGNGTGTFQLLGTYGGGNSLQGIEVADVNGDGKPDLLAADNGRNAVSVQLGSGNGSFQAATTYWAGGSPFGIAVADVNGDGKPDVLAANSNSSGTAGVLLGNGNGTFQPVATYNSGSSNPYGIAVADVNGDGKPDLLLANSSGSTAGVLLNTTGLTPTLTSASPTRVPVGASVTLTGTNLMGTTTVRFNGTPATTFSVVNSTTITATVPSGATNGPVTVTTPFGIGGGWISFMVTTVPTLTTVVGSLTGTSAVLGGNVTDDGDGTVTERGVVYSSTTTAPAIGGAGVVQDANGAGLSSFSRIFAGLVPGTTYTVRAYATNAAGTSYGAAVSFTPQSPTSVVSISRVDASPTNASTVRFTVVFAAPVTGLSSSNFSLPVTGNIAGGYGGTITSVSGAGTTYTVTLLTGAGAGTVGLNVANDDNLTPGLAGLPFVGPAYTIDKIPPTARITSPTAPNLAGTTTSPFIFNITYSEPVTVLIPPTLANATNVGPGSTIASNGTGGFTLTIVPAAAGQVSVNVPANSVVDAVGLTNGNAQYYAIYYNVPTAAPVLTAPATGTTAPSNQPTYAGTAPAGSTVTVYLAMGSGATQAIGTTTATGGSFSLTQPTALVNGTYSVYATAQNPGANLSFGSNLATFVVAAPRIDGLSPLSGPVGTPVLILGSNLTGATAVSFNGTPASSFIVSPSGSITAVVAAGTTTGPVSVSTPGGTATSGTSFVVRVVPTTVADSYSTPADVTLTGNVLTNDLGTNPRAILIIRPTNGTLVLNPTGSFSYRANPGFTGTDSFIYYACDQGTPLLCGNPVTVSITVTPGLVAPVTVADSYTTPAGTTLTGNVLTNDIGLAPRAILIIRPTHGVLVLNPDGSFSYVPDAGFAGLDSFIYYACNAGQPLRCGSPATVSITVLPTNTAARGATGLATGAPAAKPVVSAAGGAAVALELTLAGHPNPFGDELQLSFSLPIAQAYTLAVYDAQGRLVQQLASGQAKAGQAQQLAVSTRAYAAGLYLVRLSTATGTRQLKLIKQ